MGEFLLFWVLQILVLLTGVSIGHSILKLKIRREENKKREIEKELLEKRSEILKSSSRIAQDIEEVLFKAKVQQEINDILRKAGRS